MKCAWILPVLLCLGLGGFIAPVALYGVLAAVMLRNRKQERAEGERA